MRIERQIEALQTQYLSKITRLRILQIAALSLSVAEVGCEALSFDLALNLVCWQHMNDIFLLQIALLGAVASANASMMENAWK